MAARQFAIRIVKILAIAIGAGIALLFAIMWFGAAPIVNRIYANVLPETERVMPVTASPVEPVSGDFFTLGGRGEGLSCSIPWQVSPAFRFRDVSTGFRQACAYHDFCYRHGAATYGFTQSDCDQMLQKQAYRLCRFVYSKGSQDFCQQEARKVLAGVRLGGSTSFRPKAAATNAGSEIAHLSTFFEFDQYPLTREEYSVARVAPVPALGASPSHLPNAVYYFTLTSSGLRVTIAKIMVDGSGAAVRSLDAHGSPQHLVSVPVVEAGSFRWWRLASDAVNKGTLKVIDPRSVSDNEWRDLFVDSAELRRPSSALIFADPRDATSPFGPVRSYVAFSPHSCVEKGPTDKACFARFSASEPAIRRSISLENIPKVKGEDVDRYRSFVMPPHFASEGGELFMYFTRKDTEFNLLRVQMSNWPADGKPFIAAPIPLTQWKEDYDPVVIVPGEKPALMSFKRSSKEPRGSAHLVSIAAADHLLESECRDAEGKEPLDGTWLDLPPLFIGANRAQAILKRVSPKDLKSGAAEVSVQLRKYETLPAGCTLIDEGEARFTLADLSCPKSQANVRALLLGQSIVANVDGDPRGELDLVITNPQCPEKTLFRANVFAKASSR